MASALALQAGGSADGGRGAGGGAAGAAGGGCMTPGAIEHITNAMTPNVLFFWDRIDLPFAGSLTGRP